MDGLEEEDEAVEIGSTPSPAGAKRPRRCVQLKLSWAVPRVEGGNGTGAAAAEEGKREELDESEGEEKGKRKKKGKTNRRTPKKSQVTSKQVQGLNTGNKSCPGLVRRNPRWKQNEEQLEAVALKVGNDKCCKALKYMPGNKNSKQLKNGSRDEAETRKAATSDDSSLKESYSMERRVNDKSDATMDLDGPSLHMEPQVCDLWLEAKAAAAENVQLSSGKRMHPFFTCWKAAKTVSEAQAIKKVEGRHLSGLSFPPVHVFDKPDDVISLDWKNWAFTERNLLDSSGCSAWGNGSSVFKGSVKPLRLGAVCRKEMHLNQLLNTAEKGSVTSAKASPISSSGENQSKQLLSHLNLVHVNGNSSLTFRCGSCVNNLESNPEDVLLNERLASYSKRCSCQLECSLWINKYQPENASEVCGNSESVRFLSQWLRSRHERRQQSSQNCKSGGKSAIEDSEVDLYDCEDDLYRNDSDLDDREEATTLKNVLLITGPVGSGKSAAIYACAKEQGFEVIEVSASDLRNGAHVKQKFGGAMESNGLNMRSVEELIGPREKHNPELLSNTIDIREAEDLENCSIEMASKECKPEKTPTEGSCNVIENRSTLTLTPANKIIILFEDVDIVFDEDRGFISTILQLAETAKRPIILTSNKKNPMLPQVLAQVILEFKHPSSEELLSLSYMICASENAQISAQLLECLIRSCPGDIRKTLMLLQFWCQGKRGHTDRKVQFTTLQFDIDAAHLVMPRLIPWDFRCELSEKVGEEINKSISLVEQLMGTMKQEELNSKEMTYFSKMRKKATNTIKTRKKRRLKRKNSSLDCAEFSAQADDLNDLSDASDFPVTDTQRKVKHRPGTILSSQSEDELCANNVPHTEITSVAPDSHLSADNLTLQSLQAQEVLSGLDLCTDPIHQSRRVIDVQNPSESLERISASYVSDSFKLLDVSFVPESSFISETRTYKKDDLLSLAASSNNASVCFTDFWQSTCVPPEGNVDNLGRIIAESVTCSESNAGNTLEDLESVHRDEEQGDFQNAVEGTSASGYQLMDECSRIDFNVQLTPGKCSKCSQEVVSVQEKWRKLRSQREDLKSYLKSNKTEASSIIKFASGLADLISETDIMFSSCNPLISDILEPSLTPCVEPDASWYDEQFEMGSTYAQHGLCFYTNRCLSLGSELGFESTLDLAQEMLASSTNVMARGKLLTQGHIASQNLYDGIFHAKAPRYDISIGRELKSRLHNIILSMTPARLSMTFTGIAFHEYLSFMSQISKLECSQLSKRTNGNPWRRSRPSMRCLSSGTLSLSPDDVEFLNQRSCFSGGSAVGSTILMDEQ